MRGRNVATGAGPGLRASADFDNASEHTMSYFRHSFSSFEEFQREGMWEGGGSIGKDELEMLRELEAEDDPQDFKRRRRRSVWD